MGSSANWTCFPLRFPDLAEEGLGFVSLDPTMLYVDGNGEGMEVGLEKMKADEDDVDEQFERKNGS